MKICVGVYVQILPKGFKVCANGLIVVKITVAVGGKSGNKTFLYTGDANSVQKIQHLVT